MNALLTHAMTHIGHKSQMQSAWSIIRLTRFSSESPGNYDSHLTDEKIDVHDLCSSPRRLCLPVYQILLESLAVA